MTDESSGFDPTVFLGATMTEANTRRPPIPAGSVLVGTFGEPKYRKTVGQKEDNMGQVYHWLDIPVEIELSQSPAIQQALGGIEKVVLTHSFRLDFGLIGLDMSPGKNNGLRQVREALGLNVAGQPFSIPMIQGRPARFMIKNETYQGDVLDKIGSVSKV